MKETQTPQAPEQVEPPSSVAINNWLAALCKEIMPLADYNRFCDLKKKVESDLKKQVESYMETTDLTE